MSQRHYWWVAAQTAGWIARHPVESVAVTALVANPTTRTWAMKTTWMLTKETAKFGARTVWKTGALTYSELVAGSRLASMAGTAGVYAGAVGAGLLLGSIVGTTVAYAGWGSKGASDAVRLYSGQVSLDEYTETVGRALKQTFF